jgi:hypothetical protein
MHTTSEGGSSCDVHEKSKKPVIEDHSWQMTILAKVIEWLLSIHLAVKHGI